MWSAIPVALLCMIVNWSERKQGSDPEERTVFKPERADSRPERADFRPERAWGD